MHRIRYVLLAALLATTVVRGSHGTEQTPTPTGVWLHANERIQVEIGPCGDRLCGEIVWFSWPNDAEGLPLADVKNPDPMLRTRPLLGLIVLRDLRRVDARTWEDGKIYNPDDGKEYSARMSIQDGGSLRVRAYLLLPLFGQTQLWKRVS
jgi:uncharacterized protein (DUF2147 family)